MMIINRKFLRERRHSRISRRHLCNSTAAAAFRFDVSARLRLLMARRYGVTRPPGPLPPSREERRGGWRTTKSAKAPKLQEDKRMHASSFYGRPMLEPRWRRRREKSEWSERAREREGTHALSKCATLWAPLGTLALFSRGTNPPLLLLSTVRSYQIFSFFFFFFSLASYAATTLSLSTGVSRVLVSDHRQVDNLFGVEGEQGTERALFLFRAFLRWMERLGDSDVGFIRDNF